MSIAEDSLNALREEYNRWEALIGSLNEEQLCAPLLSNRHSIKDELGHLHGWQQISIARMQAAHSNTEPVLPDWLAGGAPEEEDRTDDYNARIHAIYQDQPWAQVYQQWSAGFQRFLQLAETLPEQDLLDTNKYVWLRGYALIDVLKGSYEHHHVDHYEPLTAFYVYSDPK